MIDFKKIVLSVFLSFSFLALVAQEEKLPSYFSNSTEHSISLPFIGQIQNVASERSTSYEGFISLEQIGDSNQAVIENRFSLGFQKIQQVGSQNFYGFTNYNNGLSVNLGVLQLGNGNHLKITGSNSLFNNMSIIQSGGARMEVLNY